MATRKDRPIEGWLASWYAAETSNDHQQFVDLAQRLARGTPAGGKILEIAPGPGFLAVELAKLGRSVTGLDLSRAFVRIAAGNAAQAGVQVDFRQGNAAAMPLQSDAFDLIVCRAAFKNFAAPVAAMDEMHRVLRPGGRALIIDLRRDASVAEIDRFIDGSSRGWLSKKINKAIFRYGLIPSAYLEGEFQQFATLSRFGKARVEKDGIGYEVWLEK